MTPKPQANKTIPEILEQLWEKRGRHSKLPMYPKTESIAEATQAIQALITEARIDELLTYKSNLPDVDSTEVWLNTRLQQLKEKL